MPAKVKYLSFHRARAVVRKLGLKTWREWAQWSKSGTRPNNIPADPRTVYRDAGWISYPDWLGYEPRHGGQSAGVSFLPFNRARAVVRKLGLKSAKEWNQWSKSGARPNNIPGSPDQVYRDAGWISWPDWLGYEPRQRQGGQHAGVSFLPFNRARAAVRKLRLRTQKEWHQWCKSGARPNNIPTNPYKVYRDAGWISWPDWLGYEPRRQQGGQHAGVSFLPFNRACAVVRKLELRSGEEWQQWSKSGVRPNNIPAHPERVYRDAGWISWPDWLGYEPRQGGQHAGVSFLPFDRACAVVRKLRLRTREEWNQWSKSGARPNNIPGNPDKVYRDAGWISYPDWLGYEPHSGGQNAGVSFLPFNRARTAVRKLRLKSQKEWRQWSKSGARPNNIPGHPHTVYCDVGWISWPDWLGYEPRQGGPKAGVLFLPFNAARAAVSKLGLRSWKEWNQWSKSGARPNNIPANPNTFYRDAGWISYPDWLGYERTTRNQSTRGTKRKRTAAAAVSSSTPAPPSPQPAAEAAEAEAPPSDDDDYDNDCPVCFEPIPGAKRVRLRCSHWFCDACVRNLAKTAAAMAQEEGGGDGLGRVSRQGVMVSCPMCRARVRVATAE